MSDTPAPFEHRPQQFVGVADPLLVYVGVAKRDDFDKIGAPCHDHGENEDGHVLTKTVGGERDGEPTVVFQYWLKSLTSVGFTARRAARTERVMTTSRTPVPGDPFALTDEPSPVAVSAGIAAPLRACVQPAKPGQKTFEAELLGRVGNGKVKIKIKLGAGTIFAVDRFRLFAVDKPLNVARPRIDKALIDALPWAGAGVDPLTQPRASDGPPWRVLP